MLPLLTRPFVAASTAPMRFRTVPVPETYGLLLAEQQTVKAASPTALRVHRRHTRDTLRADERHLLQLLSVFGAVPLSAAVRVMAKVRDRPLDERKLYPAVSRLVRRHLVAQARMSRLGFTATPDVRWILFPGPAWGEWAETYGLPRDVELLSTTRMVELRERALLGSEMLRRVAAGWAFLRDEAWLEAVARALPTATTPSRDFARYGLDALHRGLLVSPAGVRIAGLVPPSPMAALPSLLVGGLWTDLRVIPPLFRAAGLLSHLGPLELVAYRRSERYRDRLLDVRRAVRKKEQRPTVTTLRRGNGGAWVVWWRQVMDAVDAAPADVLRAAMGRVSIVDSTAV